MRLTKKEYLDLLRKSARDGTFPSIESGKCLYRTQKGQKCAIGVLIPDTAYNKVFEEISLHELTCFLGPFTSYIPDGIPVRDLSLIQSIHDKIAIDDWNDQSFIDRIETLLCFQDVIEKELEEATHG